MSESVCSAFHKRNWRANHVGMQKLVSKSLSKPWENKKLFCSCLILTLVVFVLWQLESLRSRLDEREELLKQKEKKLLSVSSEHSENSYAVENLQSVLSTKERQITSLKQKVKWSFTFTWRLC